MPEFRVDWFSQNAERWTGLLAPLAGRPNLEFLEVGAFEGMATVWLLTNVLTDPSSRITAIDTWDGSPEHGPDLTDGLWERFLGNIDPWLAQVTIIRQPSWRGLRQLRAEPWLDFAYLDGSHDAPDVLSDLVLTWPLIKPGGVLVCDDYPWQYRGGDRLLRPAPAINAFRAIYAHQFRAVEFGWQATFWKAEA